MHPRIITKVLKNTYLILNELLILKSLGLSKTIKYLSYSYKKLPSKMDVWQLLCFLCWRCIWYFVTLFLVNYKRAILCSSTEQKETMCMKLDEATKLNWNGNAGTFARQRIMEVRGDDDFCYNKQCHTFQNALQIPCLFTHFSCRFQIWKKLKFACGV